MVAYLPVMELDPLPQSKGPNLAILRRPPNFPPTPGKQLEIGIAGNPSGVNGPVVVVVLAYRISRYPRPSAPESRS